MFRQRQHGRYIPIIQGIIDVIIFNGVFIALSFLLEETAILMRLRTASIAMLLTSMIMWPIVMMTHNRRMLRTEKLVMRAILAALVATMIIAAFLMFAAFDVHDPGFFALLFGGFSVCLIIAWLSGLLFLSRVRRHGRNLRCVVIYGTGSGALKLAERLTRDNRYGYRILGYFNNTVPENFTQGNYCGNLDDMAEYCATHDVNEIFYAASTDDDRAISRVIRIADDNFCRFYIVPLMSSRLKMQFYMITLNGTIPSIGIHPSPLSTPLNITIKRAFDILFSGAFLLVSPLIFIPVAIAIKCSSPGPVFFKQKRTGYMGNEFTCYKFRTMKVNSSSDSQQASRDDDRKTRLGNFLRHTSIDELPQFYNVFRGDMSVVGPRPHMLAHTEEYRNIIKNYMVRHLVKPGITGWAQVQGFRGATDELWKMEKRVDNDVWYIEHWSFLLDIKIIIKTITNALRGEENAY